MKASAQLGFGPFVVPSELRGEMSAKDVQPRYLTEAVATVLHAQRGTVKRVATALDVRERDVYAVADINSPKPIKAWWVPVICQETRTFTLLDIFEARVGRCAFVLPPVNPHADEMNRELARTVLEFGRFLETNGDVFADGRLEPHEVPLMLGAIDTMLADLSKYRAMVVDKASVDAPATMAKAALR